ncbi:hypothetical protein [Spiroplasma endosymbiont of Amphimallon solstitiale]|uniref:hypothetical protein n=1 Tax=Spiroplasma endosymbiont of Amphimallon solstitiale TaxID=3066288 RepID=UPI00313BC040
MPKNIRKYVIDEQPINYFDKVKAWFNALKTLASLVAENGFTDGCSIFPNNFFTLGILGTATAMSITDGLNLQLDNYKKPLLQPILNGAKWIWTKTKSFGTVTKTEDIITF